MFVSTPLFLCLSVWITLGMSCPSSPTVPGRAEMSPQQVSVSSSAFLSLQVGLSVSLFLPSHLLLSVHLPVYPSVCLPAISSSLLTGPSLPHTEPHRKTNISLFLLFECPRETPSTKQTMSCVTTANSPLPPPLHSPLPPLPLNPVKQPTTISPHCNAPKQT